MRTYLGRALWLIGDYRRTSCLLAPVLARVDGVTDDPDNVATAEAILMAAESADGVGLIRSEIAARAGLDASDARFAGRFDLLRTRPGAAASAGQQEAPVPALSGAAIDIESGLRGFVDVDLRAG